MAQAAGVPEIVGYPRGLLAGIGAGILAGMAAAATGVAMHSRIPSAVPALWSGVASGVLGGLVYAGLTRVTTRPVLILWIITLVLATIDSLLIATLPLAVGSGTLFGAPIIGLMVPFRQALALIGIGRFSSHHFPAAAVPADTAMHFVCAVLVSLLVPRWAGRRSV